MDLPKQPPPGPDQLEELPSEGWRGVSPRRFWMWVVAGVVAMLCVGLIIPTSFRSRKEAARIRAISNAKALGQVMFEFDVAYGAFPNDATALLVAAKTGSRLEFGDGSSNAMFRQFIAFGLDREDFFYCKHPEGSRRPDGVIRPGKALEAGETGYSYVHGLDSTMNSSLPLLAAPMKIGTESFWHEPFDGKAVVLRMDNSVDVLLIRRSDGKAMAGKGRTLLEPAKGGLWPAGWKIDLRHPAR